MLKSIITVVGACLLLSSCVQSSIIVSKNEAYIRTYAAGVCGSIGAAQAAEKQVAIETIKAGYDRYIIWDRYIIPSETRAHGEAIGVRMYKDGEPGSEQALSARETLGPKWAAIVKYGVYACD